MAKEKELSEPNKYFYIIKDSIYTSNYTCGMCKSADTKLEKDSSTRLWMVKCDMCGASRSSAAVKSGYHSVTKSDRKAAKAAKLS